MGSFSFSCQIHTVPVCLTQGTTEARLLRANDHLPPRYDEPTLLETGITRMENPQYSEIYETLIRRVFRIDDITLGSAKEPYIARFRGELTLPDSIAAYEQLYNAFKPYRIIPLFRKIDDQQVVLLVAAPPERKPSNPRVNILFFVLTLLSILFSGALSSGVETPLPAQPLAWVAEVFSRGWPFALAMISILVTHEFGHYLVSRRHGVKVSLPYFIPLPFTPFGTMGAFINIKEPPKNRRQLLDIALAGPLAGFVVSVAVVLIGLSLSTLERLPLTIPEGQIIQMEGNSLLYLLLKFIQFGKWLPEPGAFGGVPPLLYWVRYLFTGQPAPLGSLDVFIHPVAWAGWAGLLLTSINLLPVGQLDGGHLAQLLFGKKTTRKFLPVIFLAMVAMGFVWSGWWLWALIILIFGQIYAEPLDQITELNTGRKWLAAAGFFLFLITFTPIPLLIF